MTTTRNIFVLILISGLAFFCSNYLLDGTLKNNVNLGGELKSPPDSLYTWSIGKEAPFKYRVLHRAVVLGTYNVLNQQKSNTILFYRIYTAYTLAFQLGAVILFYFFLGVVGLHTYRLSGAILFALLPPLLLAYNVPVHTREDTLAYSILLVGLIAIIKDKPALFLVVSIVGVLCRETLLILPFVYVAFSNKQTLGTRLLLSMAAVCVFFGVRLHYGLTRYDHAEGLRWNLHHPDQVIGFLFISFGFLWLPFFLALLQKQKVLQPANLLSRSGFTVLSIILATTFLGGIFNEIRLLYLLAPWVITLSLQYYQDRKNEIKEQFLSIKFLAYLAILAILMVLATVVLLKNYAAFIPPSNYGIAYPKWIVATCIQLFLTLATAPLLLNRR